jgi:ATP/maltotriose-dependent transcriptional regulator MalT/DNA-binding transcriptional ArsR family regulator
MPSSSVNILKLMGNKINAKIVTLLRSHPMGPRDLARYLNKNEADIDRRLRVMESAGLVRSKWGTRLGKNVKLYNLTTDAISISFRQDGLEVELNKGLNRERITQRLADFDDLGLHDYPAESVSLIGRDMELKMLFDKTINFLFVVGVAGVGKTSLARKFLHIEQQNDNKVFWHTFKEIDTLNYLISKISVFLSKNKINDISQYLDLLDATNNNEHESENLEVVTDAINKVNCVMVFDDFHIVRDEKISIFLRHLQRYSMNKTIVLSRSQPPFFLDHVQSKELVLQGLPLEDARKMMVTQLEAKVHDSNAAEVWSRFGGNPMALKIFCLLARERRVNDDSSSSVISADATIKEYFQKEILEILGRDEQNILLTLSVFRTPVKARALKNSNINQRNLTYLLHSLEKKLIVNRTASDKFLVHDMLRDILYPTVAYLEDAHASAAQYYFSEGTTVNVVESLYHFAKCYKIDKIFEILKEEVTSEKYRFVEEGYAVPLAEILEQIDIQNVDHGQLIYLYNILGRALSMIQKWDQAKDILEKAVKLSKNISNDLLLAYSLRNYADSLYLHGELHGSEKRFLHAASIFGKHDKTEKAQRIVYMRLARLYFATGRAEESKKYSDMARSISLV